MHGEPEGQDIENIKSLQIEVCKLCGGRLYMTSSCQPPGVLSERNYRFIIHVPTSRNFATYEGRCDCWDHGLTPLGVMIGRDFWDDGDG